MHSAGSKRASESVSRSVGQVVAYLLVIIANLHVIRFRLDLSDHARCL